MKIENVRIYVLPESLIASGYPMLSTELNEEEFLKEVEATERIIKNKSGSNKHIERGIRLGNSPLGSGHNCALKGITVQFDLTLPQYTWQQLQRYHYIDFISSMSKMHRITMLDLDKHCPLVDNELLKISQRYVNAYKKGEIGIDACLSNIPMGLQMTARMTTNYLQLLSIYHQRNTHRSDEWKEFCFWVKTLPMFKELCLKGE